MNIVITRKHFLPSCTIGTLEVVFENIPVLPIYICDTLEPHAIDWSKQKKVIGKTAIPCGEYDIEFRFSGTFRKQMPYLKNVPHFDGIMIHTGNLPSDTRGCILVGHNPLNDKGIIMAKLVNSRILFSLLEKYFNQANMKHEKIKIIIKEDRRD